MPERKLLFGAAHHDGKQPASPGSARQAGPRRRSDLFAYREWRHSLDRLALHRLTIFRLLRLNAEEDGTNMNTRNLMVLGGVAALSLALIALPAPPAKSQAPDDCAIARLEQKLEQLRARLEDHQDQLANFAESRALLASQHAFAQHREAIEQLEALPGIADDELNIMLDEEGSGWLGVETHEVTAEKAKELKLSAERGVVLGKIVPDSPAAKAGLKENDAVTEINGQRVEGTAQFRRMIHETP